MSFWRRNSRHFKQCRSRRLRLCQAVVHDCRRGSAAWECQHHGKVSRLAEVQFPPRVRARKPLFQRDGLHPTSEVSGDVFHGQDVKLHPHKGTDKKQTPNQLLQFGVSLSILPSAGPGSLGEEGRLAGNSACSPSISERLVVS